jgi:tetratricopeptide (TPR) repeat protein
MKHRGLKVWQRALCAGVIALALALQACTTTPTSAVSCGGSTAKDRYDCGFQYQFVQGNYEAAIREYTEALRLDPGYLDALNNRGIAYRRTHDPDSAIRDFSEAIRRAPQSVSAYNNRANAHTDKGDANAALADWGAVLEIDPTFADAYYGRAGLRYWQNEMELAIQDFTAAIRYYGEAANGPSERVKGWFENGRYGEQSLRNPQIREIDEYLADAYFWRAKALREMGDPERALLDQDEAERIDPSLRPST